MKAQAVPVAAGRGGKTCPLCLGHVLGALLLIASCTGLLYRFCRVRKPGFVSIAEQNLVIGDDDVYTSSVDVSRLRVFSFLAVNAGPNPVVVQPQQSPDGVDWDSFGELAYLLEPGKKHLLVPQHFLRFARVKLQNARRGQNSAVTVWFQGQS